MGSHEDEPRRRGRPPKPLHAGSSSAARLGIEIRRHRERRGLTQADLGAIIGFSPKHLSSVERGATSVSEQFVQACDDALGAGGKLLELLPPVVYERARLRWSNRAERDSIPACLPPSSAPCPAIARAATERANTTAIALADVEAIEAMTTALRRVDNRFGGGSTRGVVLAYLNKEVAPLLRAMQVQSAATRRLIQAAAELMQLAGWVSHDVGEDSLARWCFDESLRLSLAAEDEAFASEVLAAISHQAAYLGDGQTAVDAAQAARRHANRSGIPALVSEASAMEAHGHALRQEVRACLAAMRTAERALDVASEDDRPRWLEYFDRAYLAAKFAHALYALDESNAAERFARRSLQMSEGYERGRLFNTVLLARIHADNDDLDAACELGRRSVTMASGIRSARGRGYLADLRRGLDLRAAVPEVRELREQIRSLGPVP
ncbi:MAG: helix-turn-helix domain-containing protein [Solirubrobacteraceae bacterium]